MNLNKDESKLEAQVHSLLSKINDASEATRREKIKRASLSNMIELKLRNLGSWTNSPKTTKKLGKIRARVLHEIYLHRSPDLSDIALVTTLLNALKRPLGISRAIEFSIWIDEQLRAQEVGEAGGSPDQGLSCSRREQHIEVALNRWTSGLRAWGASRPSPPARDNSPDLRMKQRENSHDKEQ